jgi:hypothetical protein
VGYQPVMRRGINAAKKRLSTVPGSFAVTKNTDGRAKFPSRCFADVGGNDQ